MNRIKIWLFALLLGVTTTTVCGLLIRNATPVEAASCTADLVVSDFKLLDAQGRSQTSFTIGQPIYVQVTLSNQGTSSATSSSGRTYTQVYGFKPSAVPAGTASDISMGLTNGVFSAKYTKTYSSLPSGQNNRFYNSNRSWSVNSAGTYTARVFINFDDGACESSFSNNQKTLVYTVTSNPNIKLFNNALYSIPSTVATGDSRTIDWKNSRFQAKHDLTLKQVGFYNTGSAASFEIRLSNSSGTLGSILAQGVLSQVSSAGYFIADVNVPLQSGNYYIFRVKQTNGASKIVHQSLGYQDIQFLDATRGSGNVSNARGTFQLYFKYDVYRTRLAFDYNKFYSYGFPTPQSPNPYALSSDKLDRWNNYTMPAVVQAAQSTGVDPGIIGGWALRENSFDSFMDNCRNSEYDPNTPCNYWGGDWQVGYGNHVATGLYWLDDAFKAIHYGFYTPQIGQQVINASATRYSPVLRSAVKITYPSSTFPNVPLSTIQYYANAGSQYYRQLASILMKDDAIGAYLIARNFHDNIGVNGSLAWRMEQWGPYYNRQSVINGIKAIYDAGIYQ
jgi:hypothetical protein